jgi:hypothetical protein
VQRRHFDFLLGSAGVMLAVVLIVLGVYFNDRYNFAHTNVRDQLKEQKIFFPEKDALTDEELGQPGLVKYAGQALDDGDKAQVYANEYIGLHLKGIAGGKTYAELGGPLFALQDKVEAAKESNDPDLASLEEELAAARAERTTVLTGETLRGLLLTTYGFWTFGQEAQLGMYVSWIAAAVLLLMALGGFIQAFRTPPDATI